MAVGVPRSASSRAGVRERGELILGQLDQLPTPPTIAARLSAIAGSDESSAHELVRTVETTPSLSDCVLRMMSSRSVHRGEAVCEPRSSPFILHPLPQGMTVARAVSLLGVQAVRNAALLALFFDTLSDDAEAGSAGGNRRGLWRHSLAVGCAAELIAESPHVGKIDVGGELFLCGLLHDIGKIALDVCLPKSYARVLRCSERQPSCVCDAEREILGLDHTTAGRRLASRWRLGQPIVDSVWLHHQAPDALPSTLGNARQVRIVHLADALIRRAGIGASGSMHEIDIKSSASALGLDQDALAELIERVPERMNPIQKALGLDVSEGDASYLQSVSQVNRRLGRLNSRLLESNRTLQLRSDCFNALSAFTARLSDHDRIADVCAAAADFVCSLLPIDRALAFVRMPKSSCLHVGTRDRASTDYRLPIVDCRLNDELTEWFESKTGCGIIPASEECDALWQRCFGSSPESFLWLLPIHTEAASGGVLFSSDESAVGPLRAAHAECASISSAIGQAVTSAAARIAAEELTDEFLNLNRRLHAAQKQLARERSISMIAQMAAGAAHELNNPLAVISGRAQMGLTKCEDPRLRRDLEIIVEQVRRAAGMVTELMAFAKPEQPRPIAQKLEKVLESACQHWQSVSDLRPDAIFLSVNDADASVYCDGDQLREILQAVFSNALTATDPDARQIQINSPSRATDETVRIVVEDNGVGMTPEVLEHALDPFFSSRPAGRGRGLGLSRAYRLAEINGGRLWLESNHQRGTKVTIELPARAPAH